MMRQMFSIGDRSGLQAGQFSTRTLLLRSHAVVIAAVCGFALSCWNTQGLPWNRRCLEGSICCSKTFIYLSAFIVPSNTCKLPILYALMHPIPSEMLAFEFNADNTLEGPPHSSDHRILFHFETVYFKWALAHRTRRRFWPCSHMASFLHDMFTYGFLFPLVGICSWHGGLCLPTVVSGSIPGPI